MQIKMKCKRALAFVLALLMLMTMIPTAAFAEDLLSDVATSRFVRRMRGNAERTPLSSNHLEKKKQRQVMTLPQIIALSCIE